MPARLSVDKLIKENNINVDDLYDTYMNNGGAYTAKKFGLSSFSLVVRILNECGYDLSTRDAKKINYTKTAAALKVKYGYDHALQIPTSKEKLKKTNQDRYGSDYYMGTADFKDKSKKTNLDKYGYEWSTQSPAVKERHAEANYLKYGVKDSKQALASDELKNYLNNEDLSIAFLIEHNFTYFELRNYFNEDRESQIYSWLYRFDLFQYLSHQCRSLPESELAEFLYPLGFTEINNRKLLGSGQEIDIYNPELKIGVEFNGLYYHSTAVLLDKNYHFNKSKLAESKGIRLIHIYENEWHDPKTQAKIKSMLEIASKHVQEKIYARNCTIKEISNKDAKPFNESNHLQGHRNAQVTLGLFYNENLVQLMSFSKTKYNRNLKGDNDWEIIRGCPASNNIVIGGVSKLFKYFVKNYDPDNVFSYCDFNKFDGKGYEAIGMKFIGYTGPDKKWVIGYNLVNRNPKHYHELKEKATACLWGAGSKKYLWSKSVD